MKLETVELRRIKMALVAPFETSFGVQTERDILLVRVVADGVEGWGECVAGEDPTYSSEYVWGAQDVLIRHLIPRLLGRDIAAGELATILHPIHGHNMAKAALENALWDIEAQRRGVSLAELLGGILEEIPCGVSIGIQNSREELLEKMRTEVEAGYQRIKVKIRPGWDVAILESIRNEFSSIKLMADANSAYTLADTEHLKKLDDFYLMMIEQPLAHDDIIDHATLQAQLQTPICLDECIRSGRIKKGDLLLMSAFGAGVTWGSVLIRW